jgi:hypothetical protein
LFYAYSGVWVLISGLRQCLYLTPNGAEDQTPFSVKSLAARGLWIKFVNFTIEGRPYPVSTSDPVYLLPGETRIFFVEGRQQVLPGAELVYRPQTFQAGFDVAVSFARRDFELGLPPVSETRIKIDILTPRETPANPAVAFKIW